MRPITILPSILASDFASLGAEIAAVEAAGADAIHIDVMDGHFVPNITFGPDVVRAIRKVTRLPFDVHLMIAPADAFLHSFVEAGANLVTVHAEAGSNLHRSLQVVRSLGARVGVALNPGTPAGALASVIDMVDLVLVMTVNPGFGGQAFLPAMAEKIAAVRAMIAGRDVCIEVDGGITPATIGQAAAAGADWFVAGSSIFGRRGAYGEAIGALRHAAATERGESV